jgi:hypothetical protein
MIKRPTEDAAFRNIAAIERVRNSTLDAFEQELLRLDRRRVPDRRMAADRRHCLPLSYVQHTLNNISDKLNEVQQ